MCVKSQREGIAGAKALWQEEAWWLTGEKEVLGAGCGNPEQSRAGGKVGEGAEITQDFMGPGREFEFYSKYIGLAIGSLAGDHTCLLKYSLWPLCGEWSGGDKGTSRTLVGCTTGREAMGWRTVMVI